MDYYNICNRPPYDPKASLFTSMAHKTTSRHTDNDINVGPVGNVGISEMCWSYGSKGTEKRYGKKIWYLGETIKKVHIVLFLIIIIIILDNFPKKV